MRRVVALAMMGVCLLPAVAGAQTIAPVEAFVAGTERDYGARRVATYYPAGQDRESWDRAINAEIAPAPDAARADPDGHVRDVLDGFVERARGDCAWFQPKVQMTAPGVGEVEIVCDGFKPATGAGRSENRYFHLRLAVEGERLITLFYRWRGTDVSAKAVTRADLPAREIAPAFARIVDSLRGDG